VALTSRIGAIFSDSTPGAPFPSPNTTVFLSPLVSPMYGADKYLIQSLNNVVTPQLQNHVNEFPDSLSKVIGATVANALGGILGTFLGGVYAAVMGALGPIMDLITTVTTLMGTFKTAMRAIGLLIGVPLLPTMTVLMAAINAAFAAIKNFINLMFHALQTAVKTLTNALLSWMINSTGATGTSMSSTGNTDCQRVQELWGSQGINAPDTTGGLWGSGTNVGTNEMSRAMVGTGRQQGTPYLSFSNLWNHPGGQAASGMGDSMWDEITNGGITSNSAIINRVKTDVTSGALSGPGVLASWPTTPAAIATPPFKATPSSIISGM